MSESIPMTVQSVESGRTPNMEKRGFAWLDSALQDHPRSIQSWIADEPIGEITLKNNRLALSGQAGQFKSHANSLYAVLDAIYHDARSVAIGFISYEAMLNQLGIPASCHPIIPSAHFFLYEDFAPGMAAPAVDSAASDGSYDSALIRKMSRDDYSERILRIKEHIREGDIYQANFTTRFDVASRMHPADVYRQLRQASPAPHCAYLNFGDYQVLSSSPERMFRLDGSRITTSPIKGTIRRNGNHQEDASLAQALLNSPKNLAELLMIVDLERNDLGRIAKTGSVKVASLRQAEYYSSLIHLVAEVSATLREDCSLAETLAALLPGGSITGAPKRRAIEIIADLETTPRSVYTGCIGYLDGRNRIAELNIAIRTMTHYDGRYEIHAGGGIVADSTAHDEYDEMMLKASRMLASVGVNRIEEQE